ncbi:hypothetical protein PCE1_004944 [Barthelona sp. PCE]
MSSSELIHKEGEYSTHNYHPLPIVFDDIVKNGETGAVKVTNPEGKEFYDFLSAYSAQNMGHCHPKLVKIMQEQCTKMVLSSRAFHNSVFPVFCEKITKFFGYDLVVPMNSGVEAVETAYKLCVAHMQRKVPEKDRLFVCCEGCFHGRSVLAISMSDDPDCFKGFGPAVPGILKVPYNDLSALRAVFEEHGDRIVGFIGEPVQGEAGVFVPDSDYWPGVRALCDEFDVLLIADEIQSGCCRCGEPLAISNWGVRPDIVTIAKAISGGMIPLSAVLCSKEIGAAFTPGTHGSTYGGNPLACAIGIGSLDIMEQEDLANKAKHIGERFRAFMTNLAKECPFITEVRGLGALNAVVIEPLENGLTATDVCLCLADAGLLAKPTHSHIIRFAPPLVITDEELDECLEMIKNVFIKMPTLKSRAEVPLADAYYGEH